MANSIKVTVKPVAERTQIKSALLALPGFIWLEKSEQYCDYRLDGKKSGQWARAKQFSNGTLYIEASDTATLNLVQSIVSVDGASPKLSLASSTAMTATKPGLIKTGFSTAASSVSSSSGKVKSSGLLDIQGAYIGTDESGKGDYFGPLVIAGVHVDDETSKTLAALGVADSKKLTDTLIAGLSAKIIDIVGEESVSVIEVSPKKYNELYERMKTQGKNLNHLLAWGHAAVIENLLMTCPDCTQAVADQFGNERYIKSQLKERGKGITLYQTPRAEANIGVAAASIIARHRFVSRIKSLSAKFGVNLPLGANPIVKRQAKAFIQQHGRPALAEVAKLHFKTTQEL